MVIIGCKWAGKMQKIQPDDYCHSCPFIPQSSECDNYRKLYHAVFVKQEEKSITPLSEGKKVRG